HSIMHFTSEFLLVSSLLAIASVVHCINSFPWMADKGHSVHKRQWYKYDCKEVSFLPQCDDVNEGTYGENKCFKPYEIDIRNYRPLEGWHKVLNCKTSSPDDYAVLAANQNRGVVSYGLGKTSKVIKCDKGKWVAEVDDEEIEVSNAFCFVIPRINDDE
uniref:PRKCSH_1 domain-containing protein n=1 Tax=Haemonchus contortus TaxID=6289 RepID=A0A7I4Z564_HAECO